MSCMFRFSGDAVDVALLERLCPIPNAITFRKGEPRRPGSQVPANQTSGLAVELTSEAAAFAAIDVQRQEVIDCLKAHASTWQAMRQVPGLEVVVIDFGIVMRNVAAQFDHFSSELIQSAAAVGAGIELSQYPPTRLKNRHIKNRSALRRLWT